MSDSVLVLPPLGFVQLEDAPDEGALRSALAAFLTTVDLLAPLVSAQKHHLAQLPCRSGCEPDQHELTLFAVIPTVIYESTTIDVTLWLHKGWAGNWEMVLHWVESAKVTPIWHRYIEEKEKVIAMELLQAVARLHEYLIERFGIVASSD